MLSGAAVAGLVLMALGMVLTPGPNMMYLVARSVGQGWQAGLVSLTGTVVGFLVYMTLTNLGLAAVFLLVPSLYVALKVVGAVYLLYLAWKTLRPGGRSFFDPTPLARDSRLRLFRMGLVTNLLNPKAAIMYLALIPQFIDHSRGHMVAQGFLLGGLQIAVSMTVNAAIVMGAGGMASFLSSRPRWMRWQRRVTAGMLAAVGLKLALGSSAHPQV